MSSTTLIEQIQKSYYTYGQAAEALGIGKMTLWRWIKLGKIEGEKLGREVLFEKSEVERLKRELEKGE